MSANKYEPHVLVLPEDDANNDIANGFLFHGALDQRAIQVLPCAGGWRNVRRKFESDYIGTMKRNPYRHMILLVDFDGDGMRRAQMVEAIPAELVERVFVIGSTLARECYDDHRELWGHDLLRHNATELERMTKRLRPILFPPT